MASVAELIAAAQHNEGVDRSQRPIANLNDLVQPLIANQIAQQNQLDQVQMLGGVDNFSAQVGPNGQTVFAQKEKAPSLGESLRSVSDLIRQNPDFQLNDNGNVSTPFGEIQFDLPGIKPVTKGEATRKKTEKLNEELIDKGLNPDDYDLNSPEGKAEALTKLRKDETASEVTSLRKEVTQESKTFIDVRNSYNRIQSTSDGTPAGDLSLIFNYMKMLDPGSTVREGEFANAENAGSIPTRLFAMYNKLLTNKGRLDPKQRADFLGQAENLIGTARTQYEKKIDQFKGIAERRGFDVRDIIIDRDVDEELQKQNLIRSIKAKKQELIKKVKQGRTRDDVS